jgi:hypothetical protein
MSAAGASVVVQGAQIANNAYQSSADRRTQESVAAANQNRDYEAAQVERARLQLEQQQQEQRAQSNAYQLALRSALGMNMQDVSFGGSGHRTTGSGQIPNMSFSGGMRPSALGMEGRETARVARSQAMQQLLTPQARPQLDPYNRIQIGDQQAYQDPTQGHDPGFWDRQGYLLSGRNNLLRASDDPNYRRPGSYTAPVTTSGMGQAPPDQGTFGRT